MKHRQEQELKFPKEDASKIKIKISQNEGKGAKVQGSAVNTL